MARRWHDAGMEKIPVAVNISGQHFGREDFVQEIFTVLGDTGLEPKYLDLEVTETAIMVSPERATHNLNQLKAAGIKVSLDDFGTGYSSLSYLQRFPLDAVKIDISFIRNVVTNPNDAMLVNAIISMANNLKLKTIAERVEDKSQLEFLKEKGCNMVQGYFFSPPVPAREVANLLAHHF